MTMLKQRRERRLIVRRSKVMPVGIDDFKQVAEGYYFVDKTAFIKELIDGHAGVTLITRPRRFGKTLTLSMLKYFFDISGAEENRALFQGLAVEQAGERYMKEQGTRPTIFFSLKEIKMPDYASMLEALQELLRQLYKEFRFVLDDQGGLPADEAAIFNKTLNKKASVAELPPPHSSVGPEEEDTFLVYAKKSPVF